MTYQNQMNLKKPHVFALSQGKIIKLCFHLFISLFQNLNRILYINRCLYSYFAFYIHHRRVGIIFPLLECLQHPEGNAQRPHKI